MKELCPCADLDWRGADMTLPHHPECKTTEVQALTIDAPPVGVTVEAPFVYIRVEDGDGNREDRMIRFAQLGIKMQQAIRLAAEKMGRALEAKE